MFLSFMVRTSPLMVRFGIVVMMFAVGKIGGDTVDCPCFILVKFITFAMDSFRQLSYIEA